MVHDIQLGEIRPHPLRSIWPNERFDLSAWMARPENLRNLGETIGIGELTLEGEPEFPIGTDHAVDIVARNVWGERVAIENQFGKSDADHLGRGLVYLAGVEAIALIWITEKLRDPHRATLQWLNENTPEQFGFFGVEIEALTIDGSRPGVRFNVIVRPNGWSRRASRRSSDAPLTDEQVWFRRYWSAFAVHLEDVGATDWMRELPRDRYWGGEVGRPGFRIYGIVRRQERLLEVQLEIGHGVSKHVFARLEAQRAAIEAEFDGTLEWRHTAQRHQILVRNQNLDPNDVTTWPQQHTWLLAQMKALRRTFRNRILALPHDGEDVAPASDAQIPAGPR